jgi:hypothetical protein
MRVALLLAVWLATWTPVFSAGAQGRGPPIRRARPGAHAYPVASTLLGALRWGVDPDRLRCELAALRPAPVGELFLVARLRAWPEEWPAPGRAAPELGEPVLQAVFGALLDAPRAELRAHLAGLIDGPFLPAEREVALEILGEVGLREDLELALRLATPGPTEGTPPSLRRALLDALAGMFGRDPPSVQLVRELFDRAGPGLLDALVISLERAETPQGLIVLAALLGRSPEMDALVLSAIARVGRALQQPVDLGARVVVRGYLSNPDSALVQQATLAVAALGDDGATGDLIELLHSDDRSVRFNVHRALREITRLTLPPAAEAWEAWFAEESRWWEEDSTRVFADVRGGEPVAAARAVREILRHRLGRHDLAQALRPCLSRPEPDLARMACAALGQLGSRAVQMPLVACLERPEEPVRQAAWKALRDVTGLDLPLEPQRWRAALR